MNDFKTNEERQTNQFLACCDLLTPVVLAAMEVRAIQIDFCILTTDPRPWVSVSAADLDSYRTLVDKLSEICGAPDGEEVVVPIAQKDGTCSYMYDVRFGPVRISCTVDDTGAEEAI